MCPSANRIGGPSSAPAAPPSTGVETADDEDAPLVTDYEQFAWAQEFTLLEPLPAPALLDLLDVVIEREHDPEIRVRAMRMASGVAEWCHERYMRASCGYQEPNGPPESDTASRDPHEVERHVILTASLAVEVGDPQFPRLAARWLGIPSSVAGREAYFDVIESPERVLRIVETGSPGQFLRAVVRGRLSDRERLRPQRARGERLLSIHHEAVDEHEAVDDYAVAEIGVEAPEPFTETLLELLRSRPGKKPARLISIIERMRAGHGKTDLGAADYQFLQDNVEMLVRLVHGGGITERPETPCGRRSSVAMQPWIRQRIAGFEVIDHRYKGRDIDRYGSVVRAGFKNLTVTAKKVEKTSYHSPSSVAGR